MSVLLNGLLILSFLCSLAKGSKLQTNTLLSQNLSSANINELKDDKIRLYFSNVKEKGISVQHIFRILQEKGISPSEADKLRICLAALQSDMNKTGTLKESIENQFAQSYRIINQVASLIPMQKKQSDLSIFGSELFTETSLVFEPNLWIATPAGYILIPDDELIFNKFGTSEKTYNHTVNQKGNIYISQVGPVYVNGLSIEQASGIIKAKLASINYKAINRGGFRANTDTITLAIKRISKKRQALDEREKFFSWLHNIRSNCLSNSERIKNDIYKDYDKISIGLNKAKHEKTASENMLLENGDKLTFEQNTNLVKLSREVYFPTIIPIKENESLKYCIQKSGIFFK